MILTCLTIYCHKWSGFSLFRSSQQWNFIMCESIMQISFIPVSSQNLFFLFISQLIYYRSKVCLFVVLDGKSPRTINSYKAYVGPRVTSFFKQLSKKVVLLIRIIMQTPMNLCCISAIVQTCLNLPKNFYATNFLSKIFP